MKKKVTITNYYKNLKIKLGVDNAGLFAFLGIIIVSFFLRFVNFNNRWGLAYDQARDAIVTHVAYSTWDLPLIGPFSASGPFVFGPYWYWFHTFVTAIYPSGINWLWIVQAFISSLMPIVMFFIGKKIIDSKFGLLVAFLTAISTAQIAQSTNLTYSTFVGFVTMILVYFAVLTVQSREKKYLFITSLLIGLSMNIHFQAVGMIFMFPLLLIFTGFTVSNILLAFFALALPFIPLLYFDFISDHFQSNSISEYLFSRGEGTALQKRWLTYLTEFWPRSLGHIIGGNMVFGYVIVVLTSVNIIYKFIKKTLPKEILLLTIFLGINFIVLRYFKGNVYEAFLVYMHSSILILVAWSLYIFIKRFKKIGIVALIFVSVFTLYRNYNEIAPAYNMTAHVSERFLYSAKQKYPNRQFSFYDHNLKHTQRSFPTVMYFMKNSLISDTGYKLGVTFATNSAELKSYNMPVISGDEGGPILLDLNSKSREELESDGWAFINPSIIYQSVVNWYTLEE